MSLISLRPYQQESIDATFDYWSAGGGNPIIDMATGLGKSVVIAKLMQDLLQQYDMRVLAIVDNRDLVQQNFLALKKLWPDAPAGINSAGLGRRDNHHRITFASIQSIYKRPSLLGPRDLVLIDEAHMVPVEGEGMYRTLLEGLVDMVSDLRCAGLSATPFRMKTGRLDEGDGRLFDKVVYHYGIKEGIEDGWLSPLTSKPGDVEIDVSGVTKRGGEFIPGALEAAADHDEIVQAAARNLSAYAASRRSWLVFCSGVKHAHHVRDAIRATGHTCEVVFGDMDKGERSRVIADFKAGRIRAISNADLLTKGFDAPNVDLVAMLRPTLSTGLFVQIIGRGTRPVYPPGFNPNAATREERVAAIAAGPKPNCLVLDFAGNCRRHGPVDLIEVGPTRGKKKSETGVTVDTVMGKNCPDCKEIEAINARVCRVCGYEWPFTAEPQHAAVADDVPILSSEMGTALTVAEHPVASWSCRAWEKEGAPDTVRVTYMAGLQAFNEWICPEHDGRARWKFDKFWREHGGQSPAPNKVSEVCVRFAELTPPDIIQTRRNGKWQDIVGRRSNHPAQGEAA